MVSPEERKIPHQLCLKFLHHSSSHPPGYDHELAVRVSEDAIEMRFEGDGATAVWSQEQSSLVVVVGMEIVPEYRRSSEDHAQLLDR